MVLVVDRTDSAYRAGHVPGARFVRYASFGQTVNGISLELPSPDSLRNLFESVGVSNATHVVLTGRPLIVTRAFYTLDYLGLTHVSALDGGFTKWKREGRAVETSAPVFERGHITPAPHPEIVATAPWVLDRIGKPGYSFVDTRTDSEYLGIGARGGLRSTGHVDGARRPRRYRDRVLLHRLPGERHVFHLAAARLPREAVRRIVRRVGEAEVSDRHHADAAQETLTGASNSHASTEHTGSLA